MAANDPNNILDNGIGLPEDDDSNYPAPTLDVGGTSTFGRTREILLNPVPPPDTNLHAHWTLNSYDVDDGGNYLVRDVSGRNNHAILGRQGGGTFRDQGSDFVDHDPASDVINVSGNKSLFLQSSRASSDRPWTFLTLGSNGSVSTTETTYTYQGSNYPVDITDATKFNKSTITFWWKPSQHIYDSVGDKYIIGQDHTSDSPDGWSLRVQRGNLIPDQPTPTANNDVPTTWYTQNPPSSKHLLHKPSAGIYLDGWYGANDGGTYTPIRANEWHFIAIQSNHVDDKQSLWIYREGEGLLYYNVRDFTGGDASSTERALVLNGLSNPNYTTYTNANGNYDEVRLYNSILTPRNIRYLYENPTGRARQLQPRPGITVKVAHDEFDNGWLSDGSVTAGAGGIGINAYAYFHGYDVDGNPADVNPYVSQDGRVTYLNRGHVVAKFDDPVDAAAERAKYDGNTFYIFYNTNPSVFGTDYYTICQPVGNNISENPDSHPWRGLSSTNSNWVYFTPDEAVQFVIGEGRFDQEENQPYGGGASQIKDLKIYQFSRSFETIRESYNFNLSRQDFIEATNMGGHFFANADFWAEPNGLMNGTFIAAATIGNAAIIDLSASKIQTGTIEAKVTVGGETKVLIDGINSRIVISD